jgi:hypothetical protein
VDKIMTKIDHASKGGLMKIKESMYIYQNKLDGHHYLTGNIVIFDGFIINTI